MQTPVIAITACRWDTPAAYKSRFRLPGTGFALPSQRNHEAPYLACPPGFSGGFARAFLHHRQDDSNGFLNNHQTAPGVPDRSIQCQRRRPRLFRHKRLDQCVQLHGLQTTFGSAKQAHALKFHRLFNSPRKINEFL
ncbi:hypothetical protein [Ralstonia solanacearum]|uniref:hypothetical protein n=1 Tax=Ralstonia solanacearum TaxID=305 RepID=UPI00130197F3|nr:hypothetical protein [Ralstonia solanacearum]